MKTIDPKEIEERTGISIGILVTKNDFNTNKASTKEEGEETRDNVVFINLEEHKTFVKNMFSIFESESSKTKRFQER